MLLAFSPGPLTLALLAWAGNTVRGAVVELKRRAKT
jgi:hypothetical protein